MMARKVFPSPESPENEINHMEVLATTQIKRLLNGVPPHHDFELWKDDAQGTYRLQVSSNLPITYLQDAAENLRQELADLQMDSRMIESIGVEPAGEVNKITASGVWLIELMVRVARKRFLKEKV